MTDTQRQLVEANLDLVPMIAVAIARRFHYGSDTEYAVSDGYIGLIEAVLLFNQSHPSGATFRTFAGPVVRHAVFDSIRSQRRARGWIRSDWRGPGSHRVLTFESLERIGRVSGEPVRLNPPDPAPDPLARLLEADFSRALAKTSLSAREWRVLTGVTAGQPQVCIAAALGCHPSWVTVLKQRAAKKVRAFLQRAA